MRCPFTSEISVKREHGIQLQLQLQLYFIRLLVTIDWPWPGNDWPGNFNPRDVFNVRDSSVGPPRPPPFNIL